MNQDIKVEAEVVSYDPVRRNGFMRITSAASRTRIHFTLSMLPKAFKEPVIEASKAINKAKKEDTQPDIFQAVTNHIKGMVQGQRFRFMLKDGPKRIIDRKTVEHLGA